MRVLKSVIASARYKVGDMVEGFFESRGGAGGDGWFPVRVEKVVPAPGGICYDVMRPVEKWVLVKCPEEFIRPAKNEK